MSATYRYDCRQIWIRGLVLHRIKFQENPESFYFYR